MLPERIRYAPRTAVRRSSTTELDTRRALRPEPTPCPDWARPRNESAADWPAHRSSQKSTFAAVLVLGILFQTTGL
jgi:hypothetical protein